MRILTIWCLLAAFSVTASAVDDCGEYHSIEEWELPLEVTPLWVGPADTLFGYLGNAVVRSLDFGTTWDEVHHFLPYSYCNSIFVDSRSTIFVSRPTIGSLHMGRFEGGERRAWSEPLEFACAKGFWKMTEDSYGNLFVAEYAGDWTDTCAFIYRSMNGGTDWELVYEGTGRHVHFVSADPYTDYLYAAIGDGIDRAAIVRSVDQGDSWEIIHSGYYTAQPISMVFTPTHRIFGSDHGSLGLWNRVYWSSDDETFTDQLVLEGDDNTFVWAMNINAQGTIFAGTTTRDYGNDAPGIYASHDGGRSWCRVKTWGVIEAPYCGVDWMSNFDLAGYAYYHDANTHRTFRFRDGPHEPNPVEGSFYADLAESGEVVVRWTVASLAGIEGFAVYRATSPDGPFERLNDTPIAPVSPGVYEDRTTWPGTTFYYELRVVLVGGSEDTVGTELATVTTGGRLGARLTAPTPNPFKVSTTMEFDLPDHVGPVRLAIYDLRGRVVRTLAEGSLDRGRHPASWDGTDDRGRSVASGIYFVRLDVGGEAIGQKLLLVK